MTVIIRNLDRFAIALSGVCLVHCLLLPFAIALMPLLAIGVGSDEHLHELMLWVVLPVSLVGLLLGWRRHRRSDVLALGLAAMALLAFAGTWGHANLSQLVEVALTVPGSLALAVAHLLNYRQVRLASATAN
jgi:hypothetical protein